MARITVIVGSTSDAHFLWESQLRELLAEHEVSFVACSAHRNLPELIVFIEGFCEETDAYICVAGWAAALPGTVKAILLRKKHMTVYGVALPSDEYRDGRDAEISITRLPPGVDVEYCGIGVAGLDEAARRFLVSLSDLPDATESARLLAADIARIKPPQFELKPPEEAVS